MDKRIHAYREDIANIALKNRVDSRNFLTGQKYQIRTAFANLHATPDAQGSFVSQAMMGQIFTVYEQRDGWSWGQLEHDGYVGYLLSDSLTDKVSKTTHRVSVLRSFIYPEADIKTPPLTSVSMNSMVSGHKLVSGKGTSQHFLELDDGSYIIARHLAQNDQFADDFVIAAQLFLGTPYLWGGVQSDGIDCSALVQVSMMAAGLTAPRDSDMQMAQLGENISFDDFVDLERGDLVFWEGHVGIMVNEFSLLHANAYHMQVVEETLWKTTTRIGSTGHDVLAVRRLPALSAVSCQAGL